MCTKLQGSILKRVLTASIVNRCLESIEDVIHSSERVVDVVELFDVLALLVKVDDFLERLLAEVELAGAATLSL